MVRAKLERVGANKDCHMVKLAWILEFLRSKNKLPCDVNVVFLSNPNPDPWIFKAGMEEDGRFRRWGQRFTVSI